MARRSSFLSAVSSAARTMNRVNNAMIADQKRRERYAIQQQKQREKEHKIIAKDQHAIYVQSRNRSVTLENEELMKILNQFKGVLRDRNKNKPFDIEQLRQRYIQPEFIMPTEFRTLPTKPSIESFVPKPLSFFQSLFSKKRRTYNDKIANSEQLYKKALIEFENKLIARSEKIEISRQSHIAICDKERIEVNKRNDQLDEVIRGYTKHENSMVCAYLEAGLENLILPDGCIDFFAVDYDSNTKEFVIDYLFPNEDIIPAIESFSYRKINDEIIEKHRKKNEIKSLYKKLIFDIALRIIYEVLKIDKLRGIESVLFNGFIEGINPKSNEKFKFNLLVLKTTRNDFEEINVDSIGEISFKGNFQQETINISLGYHENKTVSKSNRLEGTQFPKNDQNGELNAGIVIEDTSIFIIANQDEKIPPLNQTEFTYWNDLKKEENLADIKRVVCINKPHGSTEDNNPSNNKLGKKYKDKLGLSTLEFLWLNKFYFQINNFLSHEECCLATIKLYLIVLHGLNKKFKKTDTTLAKEVHRFKTSIIKESSNYYTENIEAGIFLPIFKRSENKVREIYKYKERIADTFDYDVPYGYKSIFISKYEFIFGKAITEIIENEKETILPPNLDTSLKINGPSLDAVIPKRGQLSNVKRKVHLDLNLINEVKIQHSETVEILGQILADEEQPESLIVVNKISDNTLLFGDKKSDIPVNAIYIKSLPLNESQITLLDTFRAKELKMSNNEINAFAKTNNIFKNQLIDSINEKCYELIDDILIEETDDGYSITLDYFNKILKDE